MIVPFISSGMKMLIDGFFFLFSTCISIFIVIKRFSV